MKYILWVLTFALRAVLIVLGWVFVPFSLAGDGAKRTPAMWRMWADAEATPAAYATSRWKKYVWWAWRNPTPGLRNKWQQPIPEKHPNPDFWVRPHRAAGNDAIVVRKSASRYMEHGWFWEYWYMRRIKIGKYRFFEFRIGWKFVDGNDEFFPTFQLGPRSS